jgi:hypothetical protein
MLATQFWAGVLYLLGMIVLALIKMLDIKKQYPNEAAEIKVFKTYWIKEWLAFLISTVCLFIYVLILPEILGKTILNHRVSLFVKGFSALVGLGSQAFALAFFGVTKAIATKISFDKVREEGKQEGRDETLSKVGPLIKTDG